MPIRKTIVLYFFNVGSTKVGHLSDQLLWSIFQSTVNMNYLYFEDLCIFDKYNGDLNTKLVWDSNGPTKEVGCQWSGIQMPFEYWTNGCHLVFLCTGPVFKWLV